MELSTYLTYITISVIASASVGPSVILAASNGINFGRRKALKGVLGHVSAIFLLAITSATGLGALLVASPELFQWLKIAGVGYLTYIGVQIWRSKGSWAFQIASDANAPSGISLFTKSFFIALSNPKALVFFSSLFPQFINPEQALAPQFLLLAGTSLVNAFTLTFAYVLVAYKFKQRLLSAINKGWLPKLTGGLFFGFALALAVNK